MSDQTGNEFELFRKSRDETIDMDKLLLDPVANISADDGLDLYFRQMSQQPLLTAAEEIELAIAMEKGQEAQKELDENDPDFFRRIELNEVIEAGSQARKTLIQANTRLVVSIAKKYRGRGLAFLDLIQEGNIGLIIAVRKYDYTMGNRFSTYATWWIRQSVSRAIANFGRTIRIPSHMHGRISQLYRQVQELEQKLGRKPKINEIAEMMDIDEKQVRHMLRSSAQPMSLDQKVGEEKDTDLSDFIADENSPLPVEEVASKMLSAEMQALLEKLTPREARILRLRYGLNDAQPRTLKEVGRLFGLSRERIRQLERSALHKLRSPNIGGDLWQYISY